MENITIEVLIDLAIKLNTTMIFVYLFAAIIAGSVSLTFSYQKIKKMSMHNQMIYFILLPVIILREWRKK